MAIEIPSMKPKSLEWADPGFFTNQSRTRNFFRILKQLVLPPEGHKTMPTTVGVVLIVLSFGIGMAAYNTSSNILFMTLSLLLSSLLLSGILAWINFKGTQWRLNLEPHFRVGEVTPIRIELSNDKKLLPTYSLWFRVKAKVSRESKCIYLHDRLDAGTTRELNWILELKNRGTEIIEVAGLETQFPFGFLRKVIGGGISREGVVWPRRIDYKFSPKLGKRGHQPGNTLRKPGSGPELINLRSYKVGDPQRLVHWKASARQQRLMVRQMSEENQDAYLIFLETPLSKWQPGEQFEKLCAFAGSLAEDLYMQNRLWGTAINDDVVLPIKRINDLHYFLQKLAKLQPLEQYNPVNDIMGATIITFTSDNGNQVKAYVGGNEAGSA